MAADSASDPTFVDYIWSGVTGGAGDYLRRVSQETQPTQPTSIDSNAVLYVLAIGVLIILLVRS